MTSITDVFRRKDQKSMGIQIEYSDTRIVKWGNETERKNKIYIDQIIADIKVFSRFYACDNPQHKIALFSRGEPNCIA